MISISKMTEIGQAEYTVSPHKTVFTFRKSLGIFMVKHLKPCSCAQFAPGSILHPMKSLLYVKKMCSCVAKMTYSKLNIDNSFPLSFCNVVNNYSISMTDRDLISVNFLPN